MQQKKNRTEVEWEITVKAWKDPAFKTKLIAHPRETLKESGFNTPNHAKIVVLEEDQDTWYLVIRKAPPGSTKMSDEELKKTNAANCTYPGGSGIPGSCRGN